MKEKSDEEIAREVQKGKIEAFGFLVDRYEEKINRYLQKFISQKEDREDLVQNIFLKVFENIQSFDSKRKFSTWIYAIAHNELVNFLKKKKKMPIYFIELDTILPFSFNKKNVDGEIDLKNKKEILDKALENLELKYKEPIFLFYFENLSYHDISEILKIPVSTVGVRIKRAREKIKKFFEEKYGKIIEK